MEGSKKERIDELLSDLENLISEIGSAASEADVAVQVIRGLVDWDEPNGEESSS